MISVSCLHSKVLWYLATQAYKTSPREKVLNANLQRRALDDPGHEMAYDTLMRNGARILAIEIRAGSQQEEAASK